MARRLALIAAIAALPFARPGLAATVGPQPPDAPPTGRAQLSAAQMFGLADAARDRGDTRTAEVAYRALAGDPDPQVRAEARFRLGMMLAALGRRADAALLFRQILDSQPDAQRVRLELARMLDLIGDEAGARRELRAAQAGRLPPAVARFVDLYSAALRARQPYGASLELAIAPDTNISRATRSDTLGTVLGDFALDANARERSGIGLALRGQAFARTGIGDRVTLIARASGAADLYRQGEFNDLSLAVSAGPELQLGGDRLTAEASLAWRRFGGAPYSRTRSITLNYFHALSRESQLRATAALGATGNARNRLQDGRNYALTLSYERALSSRTGAGAALSADRQDLRDPGYSSASGQIILFGYRDFGAMTLIGTLAYGRLEADERLFIYPRRRTDDLYRASLGATFRQLTIGDFAPLVRITAERNRSSIELFDYRRIRTEIGLARAF